MANSRHFSCAKGLINVQQISDDKIQNLVDKLAELHKEARGVTEDNDPFFTV